MKWHEGIFPLDPLVIFSQAMTQASKRFKEHIEREHVSSVSHQPGLTDAFHWPAAKKVFMARLCQWIELLGKLRPQQLWEDVLVSGCIHGLLSFINNS